MERVLGFVEIRGPSRIVIGGMCKHLSFFDVRVFSVALFLVVKRSMLLSCSFVWSLRFFVDEEVPQQKLKCSQLARDDRFNARRKIGLPKAKPS